MELIVAYCWGFVGGVFLTGMAGLVVYQLREALKQVDENYEHEYQRRLRR